MSVLARPLLSSPLLRTLEPLALLRGSRSSKRGHQQLARIPGGTREFFDHRTFHAGDDLRRVNWRAYLRSQQLVVKLYEEEGHVPTRLLVDCSRSMLIGSAAGQETKFAYGKRLAAALVYIGLVRLETTILQPFAAGLGGPATCQRGRHQFAAAESFLHQLRAEGSTGYARMADEFLRRYPAPGLAIVISDFLSDGDCLAPLKEIVDRGHELWLIQLWGAEDRSPSERSQLRVVNVESQTALSVSMDSNSIRSYEAAFDRHSNSLRKVAGSRGGRYASVSTSAPLRETLFGAMITAGMIG